jgi:CRISPR-associated endonuclease/helicase Cas3
MEGLSMAAEFERLFEDLTGKPPMSWQTRLFCGCFEDGRLPDVIDLPTGLGKTMVMAIWLIARAKQPENVPTRLIYVVDRRTVVDQATDLAETLRDKCKSVLGIESPAISTLRGQLADNREWSRDPTRPAIVIGTVDLIGSALLFSGYRSSYKRRPLEAGLLGQDSLLVLDEAHLSKPFEGLLGALDQFNTCRGNGESPVKPLRVVRMSATSGNSSDSTRPFTLQFDAGGSLTGADAKDETIVERFGARKRLSVVMLGEKEKLVDKLASVAIELAANPRIIGKRIAIFVKKPDDAKVIAELIRGHLTKTVDETGSKPKTIKSTPYSGSVEVLTGTMRGLERDKLAEKRVVTDRWLNGDLKPDDPKNQSPVFLVSTSAGEVGFDLNADHLLGDPAPLDSWIQRLGRVNRRGMGNATVTLINDATPAEKSDFDKACIATSRLFAGDMDVSPIALAALKESLTPEQIDQASSPRPKTVELTDILLDAWSMTSITERMPGRPEVGPWLRGIAEQLPQTSIAWRAELELVNDHPEPAKALKNIFAKHPIRTHELITINSYRVVEFLKQACKLKDRPADLPNTLVALRFSRGKVALYTIEQLIESPGVLSADPTLIFPAGFGGVDEAGMLDADAIPRTPKADEPPAPSFDVADIDGYEQREGASPRLRLLIRRTDDGTWAPELHPGGVAFSDHLQLQATYPTSTALFTDLRKSGLRIRLVQAVKFDEEGDPVRSLALLAPMSNTGKSEDQWLDDHVAAVVAEATRIADAFALAEDDPIRVALLFAARWHDEGKKAAIWQRFVCAENGRFKGKSSKTRDPKLLRGYRHEFGSLARMLCPERRSNGCELPTDEDVRELALHLIATHHGFGRPHFSNPLDQEFETAHCEAIHTEAIRRFAHLQRKYGWWQLAWLENLLRCADALASADDDAEDDPTDAGGDEV